MIVVVAITSLLAIYLVLANIFFPQFYLSLVQQYPKPEITSVTLSNSSISQGRSFEITVVGTNSGVTSDMQTLSVSFPNMTSIDGITIKDDNFTQHPMIINKGQEVGSHYQGTQFPIYSQYPMVESYNRPWDGGTSHAITIDVTPGYAGKFLVLVKSVCLPHSDIIHYPSSGVLDQQSEYSTPYVINVTKP
ncbi:MAG: hypothetical protein KGI25_04800 [Thaumarchaeota archaeon]|nr:hypothetical protein [Nitrososphaerota archaeon]